MCVVALFPILKQAPLTSEMINYDARILCKRARFGAGRNSSSSNFKLLENFTCHFFFISFSSKHTRVSKVLNYIVTLIIITLPNHHIRAVVAKIADYHLFREREKKRCFPDTHTNDIIILARCTATK